MKTQISARPFDAFRLSAGLFILLALWLLVSLSASAAPLTINVIGVDANGVQTPVTASYRWTVEEDATKASIPGQPATSANLSLSMHRSYMPVVAAGRVPLETSLPTQDPDVIRVYAATPASLNLDPNKRYYVSAAAVGYQMGGAPVVFSGSGATATATATVYLNQYPLPTAQIAVEVFEDNSPLNGAPNPPVEAGLPGFTVKLIEAGGTYGMSGGEVTQDGFGNPLGTTYSDSSGTVAQRGKGIILTDANGQATIRNLFPGKYTILVVPPNGSDWHQTSTIEGTRGIDAWVKNDEPAFFQEFGPPGAHVFVGFTRSGCIQGNNPNAARCPGLNVGAAHTITGRVIDNHNSRPPLYTFYDGAPISECWVGLNAAPAGAALYTKRCNKDSTFSISGVPAGTYELVIWDDPLDVIIATTTITVGGTDLALGDLRVNSWFGRYQGRVFQDIDGTGKPFFEAPFNRPFILVDPVTGLESESTQTFAAGDLKPSFGEGIANNIRFRDGSIYQSVNTKTDGTFAFTEVFPFFNYMVAEIDYARFKASGATIVVDGGGQINPGANGLWNAAPGLFGSNDPALAYDPWIRLNPQQQADGSSYRTENCGPLGLNGETGQCAILLEAMQTFLGQTNHIEWGKQPYKINENGGIAGIVHYAITRAENDPRFAAAEEWEPGIARVQVNMFLDCDADTYPDKPLNDGSGLCVAGAAGLSSLGYSYVKPDVDNYPFCWRNPDGFADANPDLCPLISGSRQRKGPEDVARSGDVNDPLKPFNFGDVFRWGAPASDALPNPGPDDQPEVGLSKTDAWDDSIPTGCQNPGSTAYTVPSTGETLDCFDGLRNFNQVVPAVFDGGYAFGRVAGQAELPMVIGAEGKGTYIVEAVAPPGYLHQGNGDLNVVFGDELKASTAALPFPCVGMELAVPANLTLFPDQPNPNFEAGQTTWRKCDMKAVPLLPGANPPPDFWMYTEAPVAGHGVGFILDDTASEFNHFAPNFGEKYAPPHMPVSIQDWTGREISRVYSDQYGSYNFLVPSSFTINPPFPSGVMPSMMVACMNHPGPIKIGVNPDGSDKMGIDPYFNRRYTQFCYTLQYLAGKTTYLDTPVLPIAAFASVEKNPLDCECDNGTPAIYSATNGTNGPWVQLGGTTAQRQLTIVSMGTVQVANPAFDPTLVAGQPDPQNPAVTIPPTDPRLQKTIARDYGFGPNTGSRSITLSNNAALTIDSWSNDMIVVTLPSLGSTGQLTITRSNGKQSVVGLTVHRSLAALAPRKVNPGGADVAGCGVGAVAPCKTIQFAIDQTTAANVLLNNLITIAPGTYNEYVIMDKRVRLQGWGAGSVTINAAKSSASRLAAWRARINARAGTPPAQPGFDLLPGQATPDPFAAEEAPGILVVGRQGVLGGLLNECLGGSLATLKIDGLTITGGDSGGGILASGYACGLEVSNNRLVANYGTYGGGIRIGHTTLVTGTAYTDGVNRQPNIHHNWISQNGATEAGGGGGVTLGTGSDGYVVASNYICGNFSMADGGGMSHLGLSTAAGNAASPANRIVSNKFIFNQTFNQLADPTGGGLFIGGQIPVGATAATGTGDVVADSNLFQGNQAGAGAGGAVSIARTLGGDDIVLTNNMIVNNVAAYFGGGVAVTAGGTGVRLVNNTIASNASTASNRQAGASSGAASTPQIAGVGVFGGTNPTLLNNILWANQSYIYLISGTTSGLFNPGTTDVNAPVLTAQYRDFGRVDAGPALAPRYSVLTTGGVGNVENTTGCTNTAPTSGTVVCNRLAAPPPPPPASTTLFVKANNFQSIVDPTHPVNLVDSTVLLQSALTFDEGGNFVNVIFSPLTLWDSAGALRADYHLGPTDAIATNNGRARATTGGNNVAIGANFVPTVDIDNEPRPTAVDIGADERAAAALPPTLTSISPSSGARGATIGVTLSGTNLASASAVTVSGTGVTCAVTSSTATSVAASCTIASTATTGTRTVNVTTPGGTSGNVNFTVTAPAPVLTSISPTSGARPPLLPIGGTTVVPVTISGSNLTGGTVNVSGNGILVSGVSVNAAGTQVNATFTILRLPNPTGAHNVTVTTSAGISGAVTFTVN